MPFSIGMSTPRPTASYRCIKLVHLPRVGPCHVFHIGPPKPPSINSYRGTQLVHLPGGAPATASFLGSTHVARAVSYRRTQLVHLPERAPCHASLHRHGFATSGHILTSHPVGTYLWRVPLPCLPKSAMPRPLPYVSSGVPRSVHIPGWALAPPPSIVNVQVTSGRFLPAYLVRSSPRGELPRLPT